jgi:hypothetical protein
MWIRKDVYVHTKKGKRDNMNAKEYRLLTQSRCAELTQTCEFHSSSR